MSNPRVKKLCCLCLRTMKLQLKWSLKAEVLQWDTHVSRTHRVALDWLFNRINLDSKIQIKHIDTKNRLADIPTKGISHVMSGIICCVCLTFAIQFFWSDFERKKESSEQRFTTNSKPMMNLASWCSEKTPDVLAFTAWNEQPRTVRLVMDACSSSYSEWNNKHSEIWAMFECSTLEASVFMGKHYFDNLLSIKNTGNYPTVKQMFDISEKLTSEESVEICGVNAIRDDSSWKLASSVSDEEIISLSHIFKLVLCYTQKFITTQNFGHSSWWINGIRLECFPIHLIADLWQSPRTHVWN